MPPARLPAVPRLTYLRIRNYRALRDVEFRDLTPLTVLVGPNGSGKSTVLDALAFLAEAVSGNLVQAWEKRNRFQGMRTRGSEGTIEFELTVCLPDGEGVVDYAIEIQDRDDELIILNEKFAENKPESEVRFAYFSSRSKGWHTHFEIFKIEADCKEPENAFSVGYESVLDGNAGRLKSSSIDFLLAIENQLKIKATAFVEVISNYRYIHLTDNHKKGISDAGPRERLSANGDNLPNVLYYLQEKHPAVLQTIVSELKRQIPALGDVLTEMTSDERLLLRFKDQPFEKPLPAQYMSDGTLRLAALLTLLHEPNATGLLGLEEPENELHPRLLPGLAEALLKASETRQLLVATHAPALLDALTPEQVWVLHRGPDGYTQATRAADLPGIPAMVAEGSPLGYLWQSNFFDVGDPLAGTGKTPGATDAN